jgi:hypothetical protein
MQNLASRLFGRARDLRDPKVFHQMSLVAFLARVGLGADGLSSSSYGPEEAFKALGHFEADGCYGAAGNPPCQFIPDFGLPRGVPRDRGHRVHHLVGLPPHHRGVPARRRRLHRREQAPGAVRRRGVGIGAAGRLRPSSAGCSSPACR